MRVVERDALVLAAEAGDLAPQRLVIGRIIERAALGDVSRTGRPALEIKRLAVEGGRRAELRRGLTRIERGAVGTAVHVDDRARNLRSHNRRADRAGEIVKLRDVPVGVAPCEPRADEARLEFGKIRPGVRDADDKRRVAPLDAEPIRRHASSSGQRTSPAAATNSSDAISAAAAAMSGWR